MSEKKVRYVVFCDEDEDILEFDIDTPQETIDKQCEEAMQTIINNEHSTGWDKIED